MTDAIVAGTADLTVPPVAATDASGRPVLLVPLPELPTWDDSGSPRLVFAFREEAGEVVAEAFTSQARLVDARGAAQPWAAFSVADSLSLLADAGASMLIVDPGVEGGTVGVDLTYLASSVDGSGR
jgi:hypothetical protein